MPQLTAAELAGAARRFVRRRRPDATAAVIVSIAATWTPTAWAAVAAVELGYVPGPDAALIRATVEALQAEADD